MSTEVEIATEAFIYFSPMVPYLLFLFENSVWPHTPSYFPMNIFSLMQHTSDWTTPEGDPGVVMLYSRAWLDLEKHPIVLNVPDIPREVCLLLRKLALIFSLETYTCIFVAKHAIRVVSVPGVHNAKSEECTTPYIRRNIKTRVCSVSTMERTKPIFTATCTNMPTVASPALPG